MLSNEDAAAEVRLKMAALGIGAAILLSIPPLVAMILWRVW